MEDKSDQIWYRYNNDQVKLKDDCVDLVAKCYLMLGQKPDTKQVVLMAQMLYNDLTDGYGSYTMEKVSWIFEQGIKFSENGAFFTVRNWNLWLKEFKYNGEQQTHYKKALEWNKSSDKLIMKTINKAKRLK